MDSGDSEVPDLGDWKTDAVRKQGSRIVARNGARPAMRIKWDGQGKPPVPGIDSMFPVGEQL